MNLYENERDVINKVVECLFDIVMVALKELAQFLCEKFRGR